MHSSMWLEIRQGVEANVLKNKAVLNARVLRRPSGESELLQFLGPGVWADGTAVWRDGCPPVVMRWVGIPCSSV